MDLTDIKTSILLYQAVKSRAASLPPIKEPLLRESSVLIFAVGNAVERLIQLVDTHLESELEASMKLHGQWRSEGTDDFKKSLKPGYVQPTLEKKFEYYRQEPALAKTFLAINSDLVNTTWSIEVVARPKAVKSIHAGLGVAHLAKIGVPWKHRKFDQALHELGSRTNILHVSLLAVYAGETTFGAVELALKTLSPSLSETLRLLDSALA
ncbi:MAG: hypothetical protein U0X92_01950 [Anaerolineales bacterium]